MTTPPPLLLLHMDELDLNGVLFCEFPTEWTLDSSRRALARFIRRCGCVEISPADVCMAFSEERRRNFTRLPKEVRKRKQAEAWAARQTRRPARAKPPPPPAAPKPTPKINPEEWSI